MAAGERGHGRDEAVIVAEPEHSADVRARGVCGERRRHTVELDVDGERAPGVGVEAQPLAVTSAGPEP